MAKKLLATTPRWLVGTTGLCGLAFLAVRWLPASIATEGARWFWGVAVWTAGSLVFWLYLGGEEARLVRELRVARTGTTVQRNVVMRRRRPGPRFVIVMVWQAAVRLLTVLASTRLGYAAVLLAEGDVEAADAVLRGLERVLPQGGTLGQLRAVVHADLLRARGSEASLAEAIQALHAMSPIRHVEAERYRIHVFVKALLEQADGATARSLAEDLARHPDAELHVYAIWLRVWFDLEHLPTPAEADTRLAILLARVHGAEDLVRRLEAALPKDPPYRTLGACGES